ncbi:hypothetical protein, partial [Gemmiger sp.]|uniref:hypothetical protein n=1 Tax=Gemmiger sp. TaxID=2049027 RepID=UPI003AB6003B
SVDAVCAIRIRYGPDTLGACSSSAGYNSLFFLHDQYIVYTQKMLLWRIASGKAVRTAVGSSACKAFQKQPAVLRKAAKTGGWL